MCNMYKKAYLYVMVLVNTKDIDSGYVQKSENTLPVKKIFEENKDIFSLTVLFEITLYIVYSTVGHFVSDNTHV